MPGMREVPCPAGICCTIGSGSQTAEEEKGKDQNKSLKGTPACEPKSCYSRRVPAGIVIQGNTVLLFLHIVLFIQRIPIIS